MKTRRVLIAALVLSAAVAFGRMTAPAPAHAEATVSTPAGKIRHIVLTAYKETATPEQIKVVEDGIRSFKTEIPLVRGFEYGPLVSPSPRAGGYTNALILTFDSVEDKDAYAKHPVHNEFLMKAMPIVKQILVFDYVAQE